MIEPCELNYEVCTGEGVIALVGVLKPEQGRRWALVCRPCLGVIEALARGAEEKAS